MKAECSRVTEATALLQAVGCRALQKAAARIPFSLMDADAVTLEALAGPTKVGERLRAAFWAALRSALATGKKINIREICLIAGCSYVHGYHLLTQEPELLAWILQPVEDLGGEGVEHLVGEAAEKLREILSLPLTDATGRPDYKNMNLVLNAASVLLAVEAAKSRG